MVFERIFPETKEGRGRSAEVVRTVRAWYFAGLPKAGLFEERLTF